MNEVSVRFSSMIGTVVSSGRQAAGIAMSCKSRMITIRIIISRHFESLTGIKGTPQPKPLVRILNIVADGQKKALLEVNLLNA